MQPLWFSQPLVIQFHCIFLIWLKEHKWGFAFCPFSFPLYLEQSHLSVCGQGMRVREFPAGGRLWPLTPTSLLWPFAQILFGPFLLLLTATHPLERERETRFYSWKCHVSQKASLISRCLSRPDKSCKERGSVREGLRWTEGCLSFWLRPRRGPEYLPPAIRPPIYLTPLMLFVLNTFRCLWPVTSGTGRSKKQRSSSSFLLVLWTALNRARAGRRKRHGQKGENAGDLF